MARTIVEAQGNMGQFGVEIGNGALCLQVQVSMIRSGSVIPPLLGRPLALQEIEMLVVVDFATATLDGPADASSSVTADASSSVVRTNGSYQLPASVESYELRHGRPWPKFDW